MKKVLDPIKNLFKQAKENPIIAIPVAIIAVLLVGGYHRVRRAQRGR